MEPLHLRRFCPKSCGFGYIITQKLNWKPSLHQIAHPKSISYCDCILLLYPFFLRNINTGDGLIALCAPDLWLKMSVFVAVNKFEDESLSFTEQNMINESDEPSGSSLQKKLLNFVYSLAVGKACWFTCTAVMAIQGT